MSRRLTLVTAALLMTACGVPLDSVPETIAVDLGDTPELDLPVGDDLEAVTFYLIEQGNLVPVTHELPIPVVAESVAEFLVEGIDPTDKGAGLRTSIPTGTRVLTVDRENGVVRVNLSRDFAVVGGEEELLAVAQVVLTLTDLEEVDAVAFELEGVATDVPLPNGALSDDPVGAEDYRSLIAG